MAKRGEDFSLCIDKTGQKVAAAETGLRSLWKVCETFWSKIASSFWSLNSAPTAYFGSGLGQSQPKAWRKHVWWVGNAVKCPSGRALIVSKAHLLGWLTETVPRNFWVSPDAFSNVSEKMCQNESDKCRVLVRFCSICLALHCSPRASSCSTMRCKPLASSFTCPKRGCQSAWHGQPSSIQRGLESVRDQLGAQKGRSSNDAKRMSHGWKGKKGEINKDTMLDS